MDNLEIVKPAVINEFGEILRDEVKYIVKTRSDCPFRSITDLKGFDDSEINSEPSTVDTSGFVAPRVMIKRILDHSNSFDLERYAASFPKGEYDSDFGINENYSGDGYEELDDVEISDAVADMQQQLDDFRELETTESNEQGGGATKGATTTSEKEQGVNSD